MSGSFSGQWLMLVLSELIKHHGLVFQANFFFFSHLSHICKKCSIHMDQSKCNPGFLSKYLLIWHQHTEVTDWLEWWWNLIYKLYFFTVWSARLALSMHFKRNNMLYKAQSVCILNKTNVIVYTNNSFRLIQVVEV